MLLLIDLSFHKNDGHRLVVYEQEGWGLKLVASRRMECDLMELAYAAAQMASKYNARPMVDTAGPGRAFLEMLKEIMGDWQPSTIEPRIRSL